MGCIAVLRVAPAHKDVPFTGGDRVGNGNGGS